MDIISDILDSSVKASFHPSSYVDMDSDVVAVYCLVNKVTGSHYVGRSTNLRKRLYLHFYTYDMGKYSGAKLTNAKKKYGVDAFVVNVLEYTTVELVCEAERRLLRLAAPHRELFYNTEFNSIDHGRVVLPEVRKKISTTLTEYFKTNDNPFLGKSHSPRNIEKIKRGIRHDDGSLKRVWSTDDRAKARIRAVLGDTVKPLTEWKAANGAPHCISVSMFDKSTGELIKTFNTVNEAAEYAGIKSRTAISNCIHGRTKTAGGYIWKMTNNK